MKMIVAAIHHTFFCDFLLVTLECVRTRLACLGATIRKCGTDTGTVHTAVLLETEDQFVLIQRGANDSRLWRTWFVLVNFFGCPSPQATSWNIFCWCSCGCNFCSCCLIANVFVVVVLVVLCLLPWFRWFGFFVAAVASFLLPLRITIVVALLKICVSDDCGIVEWYCRHR